MTADTRGCELGLESVGEIWDCAIQACVQSKIRGSYALPHGEYHCAIDKLRQYGSDETIIAPLHALQNIRITYAYTKYTALIKSYLFGSMLGTDQ